MGLFDGMQFNPQSYGGDLPGLLARLLPSLQNPNGATTAPGFPEQQELPRGGIAPSAGSIPNQGQSYNMPVGNQQMPVFGMPDQSALPQNATPTQGQMQPGQQMPAQQAGGGFLQSLDDNLQSLGNGGSIIGALTGRSPTNQTMQALIARGLEPALAQQIARDPGMMRAVLPHLMAPQGQTDDIKEYNFAKKEEPGLTFAQYMLRKRATSGEYGMQPIWGTGPDGKPAVMQLGKNGQMVASQMPQGFQVARDPIKVEGPTGTALLDPQTKVQVGFIPKDIVGAKVAEARGEAQGAAQVTLPNVIANSEQTLKVIDSVMNDPYRERGTGMSSVFNNIPGTGGYDFAQKVEQLKGKTFLEAFQSLKGGGAITEVEGKKAENAIARLSVAQSEEAFKEALTELREVVVAGMGRARQKAGIAAPPQSAASTGSAASVDDLVKKYAK